MGVLEQVYLARVVDLAQAGVAVHARLAREPRLQQALEHNALLAPPPCPTAPEPGAMLHAAYARARSVAPLAMPRRTVLPRLGWQAAGVLLAAALACALLMLPRGQGWAQLDGYVLRYPLVYPGYANCTYYNAIPGPPRELIDRVQAWAAAHAAAAPEGWAEGVAYPSDFIEAPREPWVATHKRLPLVYAGVQEITLVSADPKLLDSLLEATRGIPHVSAPQIEAAGWFYHERQARLYAKQDTLVINGRDYIFPQDFTPEDAAVLAAACSGLALGQPMACAFFDAELEQRCGLGTVNRLERTGKDSVTIDSITSEPLFADLDLPRPYQLGIALGNLPDGTDAGQMLYNLASQRAANKQAEYKEFKGWGVVVPLYPPERWEGALSGAQPATLSPEERAEGEARYAALRERFDAWAQQHAAEIAATHYRSAAMAMPESIGVRKHPGARSKNAKDYDWIKLAFTAELRLEDPALRDSLLASLAQAKPVHPPLVWELYPIQEPLAQLTGPGQAVSTD